MRSAATRAHSRRRRATGAPGRPAGPTNSVPTRDPETGHRLSGAALRRRRAARDGHVLPEAALPVPAAFVGAVPPPAGVAAIESWASGLNLRAAVAAEEPGAESTPRVAFVISLCRELGRLTVKAARSEKAMRLRRLRLGESDAVGPEVPVDDPVAAVSWAYVHLARLAYEAATSPTWRLDPRKVAAAKALANAGFLTCNAELRAVAERVKKAG